MFQKKWTTLFKLVSYLYHHLIFIHKYFILYYKIQLILNMMILLIIWEWIILLNKMVKIKKIIYQSQFRKIKTKL